MRTTVRVRRLAVGDDLGTVRCRRDDEGVSRVQLHTMLARAVDQFGRAADRNRGKVDLERL
jgi:hypothetical protein